MGVPTAIIIQSEPENITMTIKPNIALAELVEKGADADLLRAMIQYVAQRMMDMDMDMDMDVEGLCAAGYAERSPERLNSRNGYRDEALGDASRIGRSEDPEA
jgi:hypothetical protein